MTPTPTLRELSCADDYDPDSLPVEQARALIRRFLQPVTAVERVHIRAALDRVLACDIESPVDVPGHDNSAMDGWAVRYADLGASGTTSLRRVGEAFAARLSKWTGCSRKVQLRFAFRLRAPPRALESWSASIAAPR